MQWCFVNMSYYDHLMFWRDAQGIILEQQFWWADLHLGKQGLPALCELAQSIHLINAPRMGEGKASMGASIGGPGQWKLGAARQSVGSQT